VAPALRILVTGFKAFPGAPFNPTQALVERLGRWRRPALADVVIRTHVFDVSYCAVDRDLPELLDHIKPDAVLMFGLATRTPRLRIETRARNTVTALWPDASGRRAGSSRIDPFAPQALRFGPHVARLMRAAAETQVPVRLSHDAGRYLCNYVSFRATALTRKSAPQCPVAFIHVPLVPRIGLHHGRCGRTVTLDDLVRAGQAILMAMVREARRGRSKR
jgi:pyroglutamyl-peptidase